MNYPGTVDNYSRCNIYNENTSRRRENGTKEIFETIMVENFPQIHVRNQTTHPGKIPKKVHPTSRHIIFAFFFFGVIIEKNIYLKYIT